MSNDKFLKSLLILLIIFNCLFLILWIVDKAFTPGDVGRYHIVQDRNYGEAFILYDTVTGDMWYSNTIRKIIVEDRPDFIMGPINLKAGTDGKLYEFQQ
jgi:hypothetical protein